LKKADHDTRATAPATAALTPLALVKATMQRSSVAGTGHPGAGGLGLGGRCEGEQGDGERQGAGDPRYLSSFVVAEAR
jgi:hypothetical protein